MSFAAASTFDTVNKGSAVTLSGSNLVATVSSGTGSVRGTNRISGSVYFEMVIGATLSGSARVGLCNQSLSFTTLLGVNANGIGYGSDGTVKINNLTVATIASYTTSDNIGVAYNPSAQLIWFRVNGGDWNNDTSANQNPVGNIGGIALTTMKITALSPAWGGSATSSATAKFASASWTYTAPTGYSTVDTLQASAVAMQNGSVYCNRMYTPGNVGSPGAAGTAISGTVQQAGSNVAKMVYLYDGATGRLLGSALSDASTGAFSIAALGCTNVYAVSLDPTYQALVYDQLTPA